MALKCKTACIYGDGSRPPSYEECCCFKCSAFTEDSHQLDCACETGPIYCPFQCMDCPKRGFCEVMMQPQLYLCEKLKMFSDDYDPKLPVVLPCPMEISTEKGYRMCEHKRCRVATECPEHGWVTHRYVLAPQKKAGLMPRRIENVPHKTQDDEPHGCSRAGGVH